ncbi:MAG: ATP synthase delta/epsilon chain alpha-helix domain-containing protein [Vampirovibrionales bacterium]|nr:ATP synthase delta/epsilon chain alpha-helix domain-containing protein [Vampirovibrionales bacterium]
MSKTLLLKVLTPEKTVFEAPVDAVQVELLAEAPSNAPKKVPSSLDNILLPRGERIQFLAGHQALAAPMAISVLKATLNGQNLFLTLMGGQCITDGDTVTVLSDAAELGSDIDEARAHEAKARAESRLKERSETLDVLRAEQALFRSLTRLQAASLMKL